MQRIEGSGNRLLQLLDSEALAELALTPVQLQAREHVYEPGMPALHVYFPVSAVLSLIATMESGASAEVALVGREGMIGLGSVLGTIESPTTALVQIPGMALRTPIAALRALRARSASARATLDRYIEARLIQVAQTAACHRLHSVDARLARWLLAMDDRIGGEPFTLAQEFMAQMLGVQRPTVSTAMHRLQETGAIAYRGRSVVVADRAQLKQKVCECYDVMTREFERLLSASGGFDSPPSAASTPSGGVTGESAAGAETLRQIAGRLLVANLREQEAREEAENANRVKDQFLGMVSHELRTPLNAILGWCALLTSAEHPSVERGLRAIQENAMAQRKLIEDLLDAVRLGAATLAIKSGEVNLGGLLRSALDAITPTADGKQVAIHLTLADDLPPLFADGDRLRQAFLNVIANAVKFTDEGGCVEISATRANEGARISVRDTGRGIAADDLPFVFDRFRQASASAVRSSGLGLGLSIAQALIQLHGGTIQIESPGPGRGTTCTIDLPLVPTEASRLATPP